MGRLSLRDGLIAAAALAGAALAYGQAHVQASPPSAAPLQATAVPVGGKVIASNACYIRLPDLPTAGGIGRYGGFGAYNPKTGVLAFAGGAEKRGVDDANTIVYYDMYAIKLDSELARWNLVPYSNAVGYTRDEDRGCRELANVQISDSNWASVFGKDGCDNGRFDDKSKAGGDLKELQVGQTANATGVKWVSNSGGVQLIDDLETNKGKLVRHFAAWDNKRGRIVFGQGTYNDKLEDESQEKVYGARKVGSQYQISLLSPTGTVPVRRFGTCAAYVNDATTGLDGVIVLGGQEGGPEGIPATSYKEVWWLDFSRNQNGEWSQITSRFSNMDSFGYRREGACAYDPETKFFYSWMGRANSSIPDGARRSTGLWRTDLSQLANREASLTWERLAPDNLAGLEGRRLFPSVWDQVNKRIFVIGGRGGGDELDEFKDVWVIYPDVTGEACASLDPFAPFREDVVPTATAPGPTSTPGSGTELPPTTVAPTPTQISGKVCEFIQNRVPNAVINDALANPTQVQGYGELQFPNLPAGPYNLPRTWLSLRNVGVSWHALYNPVIFKAGCP
jgi:hypothetical protein